MDPLAVSASPLLPLIGGSVILLVLHVLMQSMIATTELGSAWNAGPRDKQKRPAGKFAGRAERASANFRETYPGFLALAFGLLLAGKAAGIGLAGAGIWMACRLVYIPLYLCGISYVRSLVWLGSMAGMGLMFLALMF